MHVSIQIDREATDRENAMRKLLLAMAGLVAFGAAAPASAADMPVKAPPPPPVAPIYNWTGFYIGAHVGGAWTDTDWFYACSARNLLIPPCGLAQGGHSASSWLAGGQEAGLLVVKSGSITKSGDLSGASRRTSAQQTSREAI